MSFLPLTGCKHPNSYWQCVVEYFLLQFLMGPWGFYSENLQVIPVAQRMSSSEVVVLLPAWTLQIQFVHNLNEYQGEPPGTAQHLRFPPPNHFSPPAMVFLSCSILLLRVPRRQPRLTPHSGLSTSRKTRHRRAACGTNRGCAAIPLVHQCLAIASPCVHNWWVPSCPSAFWGAPGGSIA